MESPVDKPAMIEFRQREPEMVSLAQQLQSQDDYSFASYRNGIYC
jgi:hypothetical protein